MGRWHRVQVSPRQWSFARETCPQRAVQAIQRDMRDEQQYVVGVITAFLDGSGGRWDWRAFTSCSLRDVELDRIRSCAAIVELPLDADGKATLQQLLEQAELVDGDDPTGPKPWRVEAGILAGLAVGGALWWANYLPGAGLFDNLHLLLFPGAMGMWIVILRNSRKQVGAYDPRIVAQNKRGRV
jgi:hypothetical protein